METSYTVLKNFFVSCPIEFHPSELICILNFNLELIVISQDSDQHLTHVVDCQKFIRFFALGKDSDVTFISQWIISKSHGLLDSTCLSQIQNCISCLIQRGLNTFGISVFNELDDNIPYLCSNNQVMSDISKLSVYFNLLYEGIEQKVLASGLILELARQPDNLLTLSKNETLIGALARVLRDDWMKSLELASNIIYVYFCFSSFDCFHSIISNYKVGSLCIQVYIPNFYFSASRCATYHLVPNVGAMCLMIQILVKYAVKFEKYWLCNYFGKFYDVIITR